MKVELSPRERKIAIVLGAALLILALAAGIGVFLTRRSMRTQNRLATHTSMSQMRGRRHLDPEATARIRAKLEQAPGLDIEIRSISNDPEALALAGELRSVFEGAGLKTRKLAQYVPREDNPAGVSIYSKHELDHVLSDAIAQIFTELDQPPSQWLENDNTSKGEPGDGQPDVKIMIGHR